MRIAIIEILIVREGNIGNCHPEKSTEDRSKAEVVNGLFPMLSSRAVNNYFVYITSGFEKIQVKCRVSDWRRPSAISR